MIELTPLDVRKKRGDFAKALRGYETQEVDVFLELVAERMEVLVKENLQLRERSERLGEQVKGQEGREHAVQEALVTAQALRQEVKEQAKREAELLEREARGRIEHMVQEADKLLADRRTALEELERHRIRFLKAFRSLLERELDSVEVEANRTPLEDVTLDLDLGRGSWVTDEDGSDGLEMPAENGEDSESAAADSAADAAEGSDEEGRSSADVAEEGPEGEEPEGSSSDNALWLSTILKRDQQESE